MKPDQLIKRRGKLGLILVNSDFNGVKDWVNQRLGKDTQVSQRILPANDASLVTQSGI